MLERPASNRVGWMTSMVWSLTNAMASPECPLCALKHNIRNRAWLDTLDIEVDYPCRRVSQHSRLMEWMRFGKLPRFVVDLMRCVFQRPSTRLVLFHETNMVVITVVIRIRSTAQVSWVQPVMQEGRTGVDAIGFIPTDDIHHRCRPELRHDSLYGHISSLDDLDLALAFTAVTMWSRESFDLQMPIIIKKAR